MITMEGDGSIRVGSMTLSDLWPEFQGHCMVTSRISQKRCVL